MSKTSEGLSITFRCFFSFGGFLALYEAEKGFSEEFRRIDVLMGDEDGNEEEGCDEGCVDEFEEEFPS